MAERPPAGRPLLEVENLQVGLPGARHGGRIIDGMSLRIDAGEVVALVGESGCGKTMTALSLMRLVPAGAAITAGRILFAREDILAMAEAQLNRLRGAVSRCCSSSPRPCWTRHRASGPKWRSRFGCIAGSAAPRSGNA